jgi:hypothetical protein
VRLPLTQRMPSGAPASTEIETSAA